MFRKFNPEPLKDYNILKSNRNEFFLTVTHPTIVYDALKTIANKNIAGFKFSIIDANTVEFRIKATEQNQFKGIDDLFRDTLRFLNQHKLFLREYDEILRQYESFLKNNELREYIRSKGSHHNQFSLPGNYTAY